MRDTASQTVTTLLSVDKAVPKVNLDQLMSGAVGSSSSSWSVSPTRSHRPSTARTSPRPPGSRGIQQVTDTDASVLVNALNTVHNGQTPAPVRQYRIFVGLRYEGQVWHVSTLEFLP